MREAHRSAIVPYPAAAMFALVADVDAYPGFVPGCVAARLLSRDKRNLVASLSLSRGPLQATFTTRNELDAPHRMTMELVEGPFQSLRGEWRFTPLGEQGSRIDLRISFQFASAAADLVLGPVFETTCNGLVDAFVKQARAVYG